MKRMVLILFVVMMLAFIWLQSVVPEARQTICDICRCCTGLDVMEYRTINEEAHKEGKA